MVYNGLPRLFLGKSRRLGLLGAKRTTITVHRSEEILPSDSAMAGLGGGPAASGARPASSGLARGTSVSSEGDIATAGELAAEGLAAQGPEGDR